MSKKVVLIVIDMQVGLFEAAPRHDAEHVVERINALSRTVRAVGCNVIFIQHDDEPGYLLEPGSEGWQILPALEREADDIVVRKKACDAFYETELQDVLDRYDPSPLIVTGCATDFCVDTSVRAAASRDFDVVVVEDGHTTADRPHLDAAAIIEHHNWLWKNLILPRSQVRVLPTQELLEQLSGRETG